MVLGIVLGIVTVIGHGLWVLLATLLGARPRNTTRGFDSESHCPACRFQLAEGQSRCRSCGWSTYDTPQGQARTTIQALTYHVASLRIRKLLDGPTCDRILEAVKPRGQEEAAVSPAAESLAVEEVPQPTDMKVSEELAPAASVESVRVELVEDDALAAHAATSGYELAHNAERRASIYLARRGEANDDVLAPTVPPRLFSELLISFMEEKNIRWGELIGGLLIVCSSIALVLSFWTTIADRPLLQFFVFNGLTASLFGLGSYIHRHWKLETTSQGLLLIATLLVPLNFLAIAAFAKESLEVNLLTIGGEAFSIALLGSLVLASSRITVPLAPWLLTIGVLVPAVTPLLVRRVITADSGVGLLCGVGLIPAGAYVLTTVLLARRVARLPTIDEFVVNQLFKLLGAVTFSTLVAEGMMLARSAHPMLRMHDMTPIVALCGAPSLAIGLVLWRRLDTIVLAGLRTAGTSLAVLGAGIMLAAVALAWPNPELTAVVALTDCALLSLAAVTYGIPLAHLPAATSFAWAYIVLYPALLGRIPWRVQRSAELIDELLSAGTGMALFPLVIVLAAAAGAWAWQRRKIEAACYGAVAGVVVAASLVLVTAYGFGHVEDHGATWLYAVYAAAALVAARFTERKWITWAGSLLLLAASAQAIVFRYRETLELPHPGLVAFLAHGVLTLGLAGVARRYCAASRRALAKPLEESALTTSSLAVMFLTVTLLRDSSAGLWFYALVIAGQWMVLAWRWTNALLFTAFQVALTAVVVLGVGDMLHRQAWYKDSPHPWLDPWMWQSQVAALSVLSILWGVIRSAQRRWGPSHAALREFFYPAWPSFDHLVAAALVIMTCMISAYAAIPCTLWELSRQGAAAGPEAFEIAWSPYRHASDLGAWLVLATCFGAVLVRLGEGFEDWIIAALVCLSIAACPLLAGQYLDGTASALRWTLSGYLLFVSVALWVRGALIRFKGLFGSELKDAKPVDPAQTVRALLLVFGLLPLLGLTLRAVAEIGQGELLVGVSSGSIFARLGTPVSYLAPLVMTAVVFAGHAIRERLSGYALGTGLMTYLAVTCGFMLQRPGQASDWFWSLLQANAIAGALVALGWQYLLVPLSRLSGNTAFTTSRIGKMDPCLAVQLGLGMLCLACYILPGASFLFDQPDRCARVIGLGTWQGWLGLLLTAAAFVGPLRATARRLVLPAITLGLWAAGCLVAITIAARSMNGWAAYHAWMIWMLGVSAVLLLIGWKRWRAFGLPVTAWTVLTLASSFVLAMRTLAGDPQSPWWAVLALGSSSVLWGATTCYSQRRRYEYVAGFTTNLAASIAWLDWVGGSSGGANSSWLASLGDLMHVNCIALGLPCLAWIYIEQRLDAGLAEDHQQEQFGFHRLAGRICMTMLAFVVVLGLANQGDRPPGTTLTWLAVLATVVGIMVCLWDRRACNVMLSLYIVGLLAIGETLVQLYVSPNIHLLTGTCLVAAYSIGTSYLWCQRVALLRYADRWGVPLREDGPLIGLSWLVPANAFLVAFVLVAAFGIALTFERRDLRLLAAQGALLQTVALALLARGERRSLLQFGALVVGVLGAVVWGLAWLSPQLAHPMLHRAVVVIAVVAAMIVLYGFGLVKLLKRENEWTRAAQDLVPWLVAAAAAGVVVVLGRETVYQIQEQHVPMAPAAIITIILALLGLFVAALAAALLPGRDPLRLSERGRTAYAYAAETILGLLFLHIRLTMPWLFAGIFLRYWPLIVMAIAYLGVGLCEMFRRQRRLVLAEPLEKTGVLLPLLPAIGYWMQPAAVHYSWLMLLVGGLYLALAVMRRSFGYSILAAMAANGGLWYFLEHLDGYGLAEHPQLWLIPPALCVLVASYLNRDRLSPTQMTTLRYLASAAIYVSSTSDIFLTGVKDDPWLPVILAGLSLAGIFAGILLRVRAFLFVGTAFLTLALLTIIWYAAVDLHQTWIWAATGIVTGIAIIAMFAVFEKKRDDVLDLVGQLKEWEA
jgi:hypothetical protein